MSDNSTITISELRERKENEFAIVVMGAGGSLEEWKDGIAKALIEKAIVPEGEVFKEMHTLSGNVMGKEGRTDLVLFFADGLKIEMGKLAMWRLQNYFIKWTDDFVVNSGEDYGLEPVNDWEDEEDDY